MAFVSRACAGAFCHNGSVNARLGIVWALVVQTFRPVGQGDRLTPSRNGVRPGNDSPGKSRL